MYLAKDAQESMKPFERTSALMFHSNSAMMHVLKNPPQMTYIIHPTGTPTHTKHNIRGRRVLHSCAHSNKTGCVPVSQPPIIVQ